MARLPWIVTAVLAATSLLLLPNFYERDFYETGSLEPVDGAAQAAYDLEALMPATTLHAGKDGKPCAHPLEVVEQRRTLSIRDRDGWYRLFWAGDEIYYYRELVHLAADLQNSTAEADGRWTIRVKAGAGPCGVALGEASVVYTLLATGDDLPLGEPGPLGMPGLSIALAYHCLARHLPAVLSFAWVRVR